MIEFLGPNGEELTRQEWEAMFWSRNQNMAPESWWRKHTVTDNGDVSTVWVGLCLDEYGRGTWETQIRSGKYAGMEWKYATRQEAFDDHERITRQLRSNDLRTTTNQLEG